MSNEYFTLVLFGLIVNRVYDKILDRDWFSARLFVT